MRNRLEVFGIVLGSLGMLWAVVGVIFTQVGWPDVFHGAYSGSLLIATGAAVWLAGRSRNKRSRSGDDDDDA